jgi:ribosomal protein S17E
VLPVKEPVASSREPVVSASEPEAVERSPALTASDSYRASAKHAIELEVRAIIEDEIKNAAKELAEEHKMVIWAAFAENKRIIREVLDQELVAIRERIEATRQSIIRTGIR